LLDRIPEALILQFVQCVDDGEGVHVVAPVDDFAVLHGVFVVGGVGWLSRRFDFHAVIYRAGFGGPSGDFFRRRVKILVLKSEAAMSRTSRRAGARAIEKGAVSTARIAATVVRVLLCW
jgi:hypothetical protein